MLFKYFPWLLVDCLENNKLVHKVRTLTRIPQSGQAAVDKLNEWFEPRSISGLSSVIVRVWLVLTEKNCCC